MENINDLKKAGRIASEALVLGKKLIEVDNDCISVLDQVEEFIKKQGAGTAFPPQLAINNIAAHFCPTEDDNPKFKEGDLVSLDVGVHVNGYIGDNAVTKSLNGNHDDLIKASREAVKAALKVVAPEQQTSLIGKTIQETINSFNLEPVKNLSGHGLGHYDIHTVPSIPNFNNQSQDELEEEDVIAIEPFATNGNGMIHEKGTATVFALTDLKNVRSQFTRQVLNEIKNNYQTLPFTTRWLTKKFGDAKVRLALHELERLEMIEKYPPLLEVTDGNVSQFEVSCIVKDKPIVTTTSETNWENH